LVAFVVAMLLSGDTNGPSWTTHFDLVWILTRYVK